MCSRCKQTLTETWLPIPGFEGRYDVSNMGRVRSWLPCRGTALPRILKPRPTDAGHLAVNLLVGNGSRAHKTIHMMMMSAFIGPRPISLETRHLDGDPTHNHLSNLAYGTHRENALDMMRHGQSYNANKTHCPQGHPYNEANTRQVITKGRAGFRLCRTCERERARTGPRVYVRGTHCGKGHAFDEANTYITKRGDQSCRKCQSDRQRKRQAKKRAA